MPAARVTIAARNEFGRITARRNLPPRRRASMRARVEPFQGITLRKTPDTASSDATFSGTATAMPPSARKRCCNARNVGSARMLSPTQLRPITTVSELAICLAHSLTGARPLPAIVHPQPKLRPGSDSARDDVVDPFRQRHRVSLILAQLVHTNRLFKLETMSGTVGNAKSEHNCRAVPRGHLCRGVGGPRRTSQKRHENPFPRLHRLIGKKDDHGVLGEAFQEEARGLAAVDNLRAGPLAEPRQVG